MKKTGNILTKKTGKVNTKKKKVNTKVTVKKVIKVENILKKRKKDSKKKKT